MSTTTTSKTSTSFPSVVSGLIAGLQKKPPAGARSIIVLGETVTIAQAITALTAIEATEMAPINARAAVKKAVAAAEAQSAANHAYVDDMKSALIYLYGTDLDGLEGCGIEPKKARTPLTTTQRAVAGARAAATRAKNGTGKKAKAPQPKITVTEVDGTVLDPNAGPTPVAATAAPAAANVAAAPAAPEVMPAAVAVAAK